MTTQEIYTVANETTQEQFDILLNRFSADEENLFNSLVRLGDKKKVALWTVINGRYTDIGVSEMYRTAYTL